MGYEFDRLKSENDIVDVIGRRVSLTKRGPEYVGICPFHDDHKESLQVNPRKQIFKCFACGTGGDVIDFLLAYGYTHREAAEELHGGPLDKPSPAKKKVIKRRPQTRWQQVKPGDDVQLPDFEHYRHGKPSRVWSYNDDDGRIIGYACRFDTPAGKEVIPLVYATDDTRYEWRWMGFGNPRPLYGLDRLAADPGKTVIISEGEKTADAIAELIPTSVSVSWPGGAQAIDYVDWTPLHGRKLILWPDNDQPGIDAMNAIAAKVREHCPVIKFVHNPADAPKGWDAADAEFSQDEARRYVLQNMHDRPQVMVGTDTEPSSEEPEAPQDDDDSEPPAPSYEEPPYDDGNVKADIYDTPFFRFLGYILENGTPTYCFYAKRSKSVVKMPISSMSSTNLINLADANFWEDKFPGRNGMDNKAAINWLVNVSSQVGIFTERMVRGRGAWHDDGRAVVHAGSHLVVDGKPIRLGDFKTRYIYEIGEPLGFNTDNPLSAEEAVKLMDVLDMVSWERPVNKHLLAGWCVVAPICGALNWRPHIWVTGSAGTGKSWLLANVVRRLLGRTSMAVQGDTSEAGLRQSLGHDAMPVVFDEIESEDKRAQDRVQSILNLMRGASTEDGGLMVKGSAGGTAVTYQIRSCFAFASIGVGLSQQSDRSRVTIIGLTKAKPAERQKRWEELNRRYAEIITNEFVDRLHARTVSLIPTILHNARIFAAAAAAEIGEQRTGDQLGALLAGAHSLYSSKQITFDKAIEWIRQRDWSEERGLDGTRDELNLFSHLMEQMTRIETNYGVMERNIGELVLIAANRNSDWALSAENAAARLGRIGFKVDNEYVIISNTADGVRKMLANTPWAKNHNKILLRIEGAKQVESTRFASGIQTRAVAVPITLMGG